MNCREITFKRYQLPVLLLLLMFVSPHHSLAGEVADKVVVIKSERVLRLYSSGKLLRKYRISLGQNPTGHKQRQGDSRTPEGRYTIDYRNPQSRFYRSLHIDYPNQQDQRRARRRGVSPGGDIFIHGLPNAHAISSGYYENSDWTDGCIAVTNRAMDELWILVKNGTPIEINP